MSGRIQPAKRPVTIIVAALLSSLLALALLVGLMLTPASEVLAAGATFQVTCADGQSGPNGMQAALSSAVAGTPLTITIDTPGCLINLSRSLTIGAGANITIEGNGLVLKGNGTTNSPGTFDIIDMTGTTNTAGTASITSTLGLNDVTVEDGLIGINAAGGEASANGYAPPGGNVTLADSTVSGNSSEGIDASGAYSSDFYGGNGGMVSLTGSTISGNTGDGIDDAGGASGPVNYGSTAGNGGTVAIANSTITGNTGSAISVSGGNGLGNGDLGARELDNGSNGGNGGTVNMVASTISGNTGGGIDAGGGSGGAGVAQNGKQGSDGTATLTANILANTGANCTGIGSLTDGGYNISTDASCPLATGISGQGSGYASILHLLPLAYNGGPTETEALGAGSVAVGIIPVNSQNQCVNADGNPITDPTTGQPITTDQRGVPRPQESGCDIGAFEVIQGSYTRTETSCPTQAQLQDDLDLGTPAATLTIDLPANCTIDLTSPLTVGAGVNITLNGNGLTLDGGNQSFDVLDINDTRSNASTLTIDQTTIENGKFGIYDDYSNATVSLNDDTISHNAQRGIVAATAAVAGSTVSDNGLYGVNANTLTMANSTITGNQSDGINASAATIAFSTITGNVVNGVDATTATVTASILSGNGTNCALNTYTDGGYNLSTDTTCGFSGTSQEGTTVANGLKLANDGALGNYGGPTQTIALGPGSVAIDVIPVNAAGQCAFGTGSAAPITDPTTGKAITTDQRGSTRPQGTGCDAGAYEAPAVSLTTNPSSPASSGWFNAATLATTGGKLTVTADFTGLATGELPSCSGASFTDLPATAVTGLNQTASGSASLGDGTHTISCGVNQVGTTTVALGVSQHPSQPLTLKIDTASPMTSASYSNSYTPGTWTNQAVTVTLSPSDTTGGSGVATTYYAIDDPSCTATTAGLTNCTVYSSPVTISSNGTHSLTFFSLDAAGNIETATTVTIKIDTLTPTAQPEISGTQGTNGWYVGPVTVTWDWTDNPGGSGIDTRNCTTSSSYTGPDSATASVSADCYDLAGNKGTASTSFKYDATPPVVQCTPPSSTPWYDHNVSVSCTASDPTSGLANTNLATFSLVTTVGPDSANGSASTPSQQVCDQAGNCVTAGPYTFMVDLAPPTITTPVANGTYTVNESVPLACADVGSGVNSCQVTVKQPDGTTTTVAKPNDIPTGQPGTYTVTPNTVTDIAGNADTTSFTYTVDYALTTLPGSTTTVTQGYYAIIRFEPTDASGHDDANRTLTVSSVELDGPNGQVIPFVHQFQYGTFSGKAGYQLEINTRNLAPGPWTLKIQIGSGKTATMGTITFTVE